MFKAGAFDNVLSISQRGLALYWNQLREAGALFPRFDQFAPGPRKHDPKQLAVWNIERKSSGWVFRALYCGKFLGEAMTSSFEGKTLHQVTPPVMLPAFLAGSNECANTGSVIYMILSTITHEGHSIDLERLLLPFGRNGKVEQIVASVQLVSATRRIERPVAANSFAARCDAKLAVRIQGSQRRHGSASCSGITTAQVPAN
jgi:hypothetical protein